MEETDRFVEKRSEAGYTLLESMLTLILFLALISFVPGIYKVIYSTDEDVLMEQEISIFFGQAGKEIQGSLSAMIDENTLYLHQPSGKIVTYEVNQHRVIRKVDGKGFEIVLQNIEKIEFHQSHVTISMVVQSEGQTFLHKSLLIQPFLNL
jgi:competence protein ComGF